MSDSNSDLIRELSELKARLEVLEARKPTNQRWRWAMAALLLSGAAWAQLVTFNPDTPALAADVNSNFNQLKTWLETKVGAVSSGTATVSGLSVNGTMTLNNRTITNVAQPVADGDVVTKAHLKALLGGMVIYVASANCPTGFTAYAAGQGRFPLGGASGTQATGGITNLYIWSKQQQAAGGGYAKTGAVGLSTDFGGPVWTTTESDVQNNWTDRASGGLDIRPPYVVLKPCLFNSAY